jgi:hypothetical protein
MQYDEFLESCSKVKLKPETVVHVLGLFVQIGRVSAFDFAKVYYPEKTGSEAVYVAKNLINKLVKIGVLNTYSRIQKDWTKLKVFDINTYGLELVNNDFIVKPQEDKTIKG